MTIKFEDLRKANASRGVEWCGRPNSIEDLEFCAIELGGETGEALDAVKKYLRDLKGFIGGVGGKEGLQDIADELGDVVISADRLAETLGIDLGKAVQDKFNKTTEKHGLETTL